MIIELDLAVSQFIYTLRTPLLTKTMLFITSLGSEYVFSVLFIILAIIVWKKRHFHLLPLALLSSLSLPLNYLLKFLISRPRPIISSLIYEPTASFPSGHAMNSLVFYLTLAIILRSQTKNKLLKKIVLPLAGILSLLIGFSRIYLGVHYPTDVLGGYFFGLIWFATCIYFNKVLHS